MCSKLETISLVGQIPIGPVWKTPCSKKTFEMIPFVIGPCTSSFLSYPLYIWWVSVETNEFESFTTSFGCINSASDRALRDISAICILKGENGIRSFEISTIL